MERRAAIGRALGPIERSIRRRIEITMRLRRVRSSLLAVLQITVGATASYSIGHFLLGHPIPVVAVTVTLTALGFNRDARPRRVLDTVVGMLVGITLSEILLLTIGSGVWQIALVLSVTLLTARFFSPSLAFAVAAGTQSMLVLLLPAPDGGPFIRSFDGLIGGTVALVVTAIIPRDLRREVKDRSRAFFATLDEALITLVDSLATADEPAADLALTRLRRTQQLVDDWANQLDSATAVARISPTRRGQRAALADQASFLAGMDLVARHLRVITRRVDFLVRDGVPRSELAGLLGELAAAIRLVEHDRDAARPMLIGLAARLTPERALPGAPVTETVLILLMRPLLVDLLVATGSTVGDARAILPVL